MADKSYRLCGFASGVDWRPVTFKEPLPPARVCNFCGFVPNRMAWLPCGHVLCSTCVESSAGDNGYCTCALDGEPFEPDTDVSWISTSRDHLAKQKVCCWNSEQGCNFVGPLGELLEHFEKTCSFHTASCPRCQDALLWKDLPAHYRAKCSDVQKPLSSLNSIVPPLESSFKSCHKVLTSIQSRVNELAEVLGGLSSSVENNMNVTCTDILGTLLENVSTVTAASAKLKTVLGKHSEFLDNVRQAMLSVQTVGAAPSERQDATASCIGSSDAAIEKVILWTVLADSQRLQTIRELFAQYHAVPGRACSVHLVCRISPAHDVIDVYGESEYPNYWKVASVKMLHSDAAIGASYWLESNAYEYDPRAQHPLLFKTCSSGHAKEVGNNCQFDFLITMKRCDPSS